MVHWSYQIKAFYIVSEIISQALENTSPTEIMKFSLEKISELCESDYSIVRISDTGGFKLVHSINLPKSYLKEFNIIPLGHSFYSKLKNMVAPMMIPSDSELMREINNGFKKHRIEKIKTFAFCPIRTKDAIFGVFGFAFKNREISQIEDLSPLIQTIVSLVAQTVKDQILKEKLKNQVKHLEKMNEEVSMALINAIEIRDPYTKGHSERVALYSSSIARELGWSGEWERKIFLAGLLHDVGKVGIPDSILMKPAKLNSFEFKIIQHHPTLSATIVSQIDSLKDIVPWVKYHHERMNGSGYPEGLKGYEIPDGARIIAVADVFDAMTSNRPYRKAMEVREALKIIKSGSGELFDPKVVSKAVRILPRLYKKASFKEIHLPEELEKYRNEFFYMHPITGLYLYEHFYDSIEDHLLNGKEFSFGVLAINDLILITKRLGHSRRIQIINHLSELLRERFQYPNMASRYGGNRFLVFAPSKSKNEVLKDFSIITEKLLERDDATLTFCAFHINPKEFSTVDAVISKALKEITSKVGE